MKAMTIVAAMALTAVALDAHAATKTGTENGCLEGGASAGVPRHAAAQHEAASAISRCDARYYETRKKADEQMAAALQRARQASAIADREPTSAAQQRRSAHSMASTSAPNASAVPNTSYH